MNINYYLVMFCILAGLNIGMFIISWQPTSLVGAGIAIGASIYEICKGNNKRGGFA